MPDKLPAILGFAAFSGTGKTTLLTGLLPILRQRGLRVGVIKYSHHDFDIDQPGKDSYRLRQAGAVPVLLVSPYRRALITEFTPPRAISLAEELAAFPGTGLDLILVEGFRDAAFPKIELHRPSLGKPLLYPDDANIIAIASDEPLPVPGHVKQLDLNAIAQIADFIVQQTLS
ncbi:molybdopterin-guanine dinucleotide biosynthesis protein B [Methylomonas paludis]|uniref:Molybdopterin-guanine dinucleotide biosynthesis protein B n=1 Tax=Methylomonas paludis TaxID=1173101 RepID=A0A975RAT5_9GAMM|nr:molybdopterin-guanine dinucleotide biosynthesis protein B [Methylomonas paludis]QWF71571.1 molybdopterin-guanine dinucleotide biosynthesis protein B [Methylomonas paludis]